MRNPAVSMIEPFPGPAAHRLWQDELQRVTSSRCFAGATRIRDLLAFLVQEALSGRGGRLKEYVIGVEVFGRGADFDPRVDTNVRTEAWRLRSRLERYYADEGAANPARIMLPRRSFIPVLRSNTADAAPSTFDDDVPGDAQAERPAACAKVLRIPALAAVPSAPQTLSLAIDGLRDALGGAAGMGEALAAELLLELGDHPGLKIFAESPRSAQPDEGCAAAAAHVLRGEICQDDERVRVLVRIVRRDNGQLEWSHGSEVKRSGGVHVARRLAYDLARALMTSPLARTTGFNRPSAARDADGGFLRRILSSGFDAAAIDVAAVQREARRVECWLLHHPHDHDAHERLASLLSWCACAAPSSMSGLAPLLRRCGREMLTRAAPSVQTLIDLGLAAMADFDWFGALEMLHAAVEADPLSADARVVRGLCGLHLGQLESARLDLDTACRADARSALAHSTLGMLHYHQHRFVEAATLARKALTLDARCEPAAVLLADSQLCQGGMDEGIGLLQRARSWSTRRPVILGRLGHIYAVTGRPRLADSMLRELHHDSDGGMPVHAALADVYLGLGDTDAALEQLNQAVDQRALPDLLLLRSAPRYDGLRRDARFNALMDQMALSMAA